MTEELFCIFFFFLEAVGTTNFLKGKEKKPKQRKNPIRWSKGTEMITVRGSVMVRAKQLQVAEEHHHVPLIEINFSLFFFFYDLTE